MWERGAIVAAGAVLAWSGTAGAQLMIPDIRRDRVMLFDRVHGDVVDLNWITDTGAVGWSFNSPKEARVVGNEIWVSDQVEDAVQRFTMGRVFIASITQHFRPGVRLDNVRGFGDDGSRVYLTVLGNVAADRGVVMYDYTGAPVGFYPGSGSYFDAEPFGAAGGSLLVSSSTSGSIERWTNGVPGAPFATGLPQPQQINVMPDGSVITVSSNASPEVEGVYHFNADGSLRRFIATEGLKGQVGELTPRGAYQLGDGNYLLTTDVGVFRTVGGPGGGFALVQGSVDAQYIVAMPPPACPCDWNHNDVINSQDYFDFLVDFFSGTGDYNADGVVDTRDYFDFLTCFFAGC
jgi:hypothetical protein